MDEACVLCAHKCWRASSYKSGWKGRIGILFISILFKWRYFLERAPPLVFGSLNCSIYGGVKVGILRNVTEWMKIAGPNYCVLIFTIFSHSRQLVFHMLKMFTIVLLIYWGWSYSSLTHHRVQQRWIIQTISTYKTWLTLWWRRLSVTRFVFSIYSCYIYWLLRDHSNIICCGFSAT